MIHTSFNTVQYYSTLLQYNHNNLIIQYNITTILYSCFSPSDLPHRTHLPRTVYLILNKSCLPCGSTSYFRMPAFCVTKCLSKRTCARRMALQMLKNFLWLSGVVGNGGGSTPNFCFLSEIVNYLYGILKCSFVMKSTKERMKNSKWATAQQNVA